MTLANGRKSSTLHMQLTKYFEDADKDDDLSYLTSISRIQGVIKCHG